MPEETGAGLKKRDETVLTGVEIHIPSFLQHLTEGAGRVYVGGSTIGECLGELVGRYPGLQSRLFQTEGKLSLDLNLYLNEARVDFEELSRPVAAGDRLYIAHVIVGG